MMPKAAAFSGLDINQKLQCHSHSLMLGARTPTLARMCSTVDLFVYRERRDRQQTLLCVRV